MEKKEAKEMGYGIPLYVPAMLFGVIPILIAGSFVPQSTAVMGMPTAPKESPAPQEAPQMPLFMPGGGGFPFPESE